MWVTAAGPLLQILSAVVVIALLKLGGYRVTAFAFMPAGLGRVPGMMQGEELLLDSVGLAALSIFYVFPSIVWALLNLMPVWPLDGGRIARRLCCSMAVPPVKRYGSASSLQVGLPCTHFAVGSRLWEYFF